MLGSLDLAYFSFPVGYVLMRKATVVIYDCYPRTLEVGAGGSGIQSQFSDAYQVQGCPELLKTLSQV